MWSKRLIVCIVLTLAFAGTARGQLADLIQSGDRRAALVMIDGPVDVNRAQPDGTTPLHWAAYRVDQELVQRLLKKGARANTVNHYGASPLAEAARVANVPIVGLLLEGGAD